MYCLYLHSIERLFTKPKVIIKGYFPGGTNDMVCHEVILGDKVRELTQPSGGSNGGNRINETFVSFLNEDFGEERVQNLKNDKPQLWYEFMTSFEKVKKTCKGQGNDRIRIQVPKKIKKEFENALEEKDREQRHNMEIQGDELVLDNNAITELFQDTVANIKKDLHTTITQEIKQNVDFIIMVGGFSQSNIVYSAVKSEFEKDGCKVLRPYEAQAAVMKGAVLFAHYQDEIVSRLARCTYGFDSNVLFIDGLHDEKYKKRDIDGSIRCDKVFVPIVEIGEEIKVISKREQVYDLCRGQTVITASFYSLNRKPQKPVEYVDAPDFEKLGTIRLTTPGSSDASTREVIMSMSFGRTEILVEGYDTTSKNKVETAIDFLCAKAGGD